MTVCLTLKCHIDLEVTVVKNTLCTLSHGTLYVCQIISKCHQPFKSYRADTLYSRTMFNLELWTWPWSALGQTYALHIDSSSLTFAQSFSFNPTRGSKDIERTRNTVIQCLTINYGLDLEVTFIKHSYL